jgi:hypothetical protein
MEALINILETNTLWATDCKYLNDISETKTMNNIYDELLESKNVNLINYITGMKEEGNLIQANTMKRTYFISFTTEKDSIALWNHFGKNGVVLEFDISGIIFNTGNDIIKVKDKNNGEHSVPSEIIYGKIKYNDSEIKKLYDKLFDQKKSDYNSDNNVFNNDIEILKTSLKLDNIIYFKKDNGFSYENEYRVVINLERKDAVKIERFRVKDGLVIPYIAINFENNLFSLKSITINPEQDDCMVEDGIRRLLNANNYIIPIHRSCSKIRW